MICGGSLFGEFRPLLMLRETLKAMALDFSPFMFAVRRVRSAAPYCKKQRRRYLYRPARVGFRSKMSTEARKFASTRFLFKSTVALRSFAHSTAHAHTRYR